MPIKRFAPPRGAVCQGYEFPKGDQYQRPAWHGIAVPRWTRIEPGAVLNPADWRPYVVVEPELGRKGAQIHIKRTGRVRYRAPGSYPDNPSGAQGSPARAALRLHRPVSITVLSRCSAGASCAGAGRPTTVTCRWNRAGISRRRAASR